MDIQRLLATTNNQQSAAARPSSGTQLGGDQLGHASVAGAAGAQSSGNGAGIFANQMLLAALRPTTDTPSPRQDESPRGVISGVNDGRQQNALTSGKSADGFTAFWRGALGSDASSEIAQPTTSATEHGRQTASNSVEQHQHPADQTATHQALAARGSAGQALAGQASTGQTQAPQNSTHQTSATTALRTTAQWPLADGLRAAISGPGQELRQVEQRSHASDRVAPLGNLVQILPAEARELLLAQLAERIPLEDNDRLFAELSVQLPAAERTALIAQLGADPDLPAAEREALIAQLTQGLDNEGFSALIAQLGADLDLPVAERKALFAEFNAQLRPEERAALLAGFGQRLPPNRLEPFLARLAEHIPDSELDALLSAWSQWISATGTDGTVAPPLAREAVLATAQPAAGAVGVVAQNMFAGPLSSQDPFRTDARQSSPGSPAAEQLERFAATTESPRAYSQTTTPTLTAREPLAPVLRELLAATPIMRQNADSETLPGSSRGDGHASMPNTSQPTSPMATYGMIAGSSTGPATAASISAPLNSPAWPMQLEQRLVVMTQRGGEQRVELRLNPPDLGPLTVSLKIGEQGTQIQFLATNAAVRGVVEQAIPQLREALAEQGITLGETSVGEQRQDAEQGFAETPGGGGGTGRAEGLAGSEDGVPAETLKVADIALDGRVDLYA